MSTYTLTQEQFDRLTLDAQEQVLRNSTRHTPDPEFQRRVENILREANELLNRPGAVTHGVRTGGGYAGVNRPPPLDFSTLTPPADWYEPTPNRLRQRATQPLDISPAGSPRPPIGYTTPLGGSPGTTQRQEPQRLTQRGEIEEILDLLERRYDRDEANILADVLRRARLIGLHRTTLYYVAENYYNDLTRASPMR